MARITTYESAKKRLEEIALKLEDNNITLEKSIELYDEAAKLIEFCYKKLETAQLKFSQISLESTQDQGE